MGLCASAPSGMDEPKFDELANNNKNPEGSTAHVPARPSSAADAAALMPSSAPTVAADQVRISFLEDARPAAVVGGAGTAAQAVPLGERVQNGGSGAGTLLSGDNARLGEGAKASCSSRRIGGTSSSTQYHNDNISKRSYDDNTQESVVSEDEENTGEGESESTASGWGNGQQSRRRGRHSIETLRPADLSNLHNQVNEIERDIRETSTLKKVMVSGKMMLNQYMVMKTLGKGSFGTVRLCFNLNDKKLYAIKTLNKKQLTRTRGLRKQRNADPLDDLKREIAVMKKLKHPNLVKLYEVIDDPVSTKLLMVMEHVQGGPIMPEGSSSTCMSEQVVVHYFRDMCMGLDYLHFNYISHGDLKPDNMLLSAGGEVKITDFGCSRVLDSAEELVSRTTGTPVFYAPEMTRREPYNPFAADIWALGVTLYQFVFGVTPFTGGSAQELYTSIANDELAFPKSQYVSEELRDLLNCMLDKDPEARIQLPEIMGHPWVTQGGMFMINSLQHLQNPPAVLTVDDAAEETDAIRSDTCVALMQPIFEEVQFKNGEYLIRSGEKHDVVFYISSGQAEVIKMVSSMRQGQQMTGDASRERVSGSSQQDTVESTMFSQDDWSCFDVANPNSSMVDDMYKSLDNLQVVHFEHVVRTISSGSFVGTVEELDCMEYLADDISVVAKGPLTALAIQKNDLVQFLASRPEIEKVIRGRMAQAKTDKLVHKTIKQMAREMSRGKEMSQASQ